MGKYKTEKINTITEFISLIESIKCSNEESGLDTELLFRGQQLDKPLLPRLARAILKGSSMIDIEKKMLAEFKRGILPLSEFQPENNWDLLALAQHHGLPTRLIDWTYNALVALWFAVENPPKKNEKGNFENGVVWVFSPSNEDYRTDTENTDPLSNKVTKIFRSSIISRRISAQAAVFTVHKINSDDKIRKFEMHEKFSSKLTKVVISHNEFAHIRNQLNILGVNNSTIFPDIDGFCKHLAWRHTKYDDEMKKEEQPIKRNILKMDS